MIGSYDELEREERQDEAVQLPVDALVEGLLLVRHRHVVRLHAAGCLAEDDLEVFRVELALGGDDGALHGVGLDGCLRPPE